MRKPEPELGRLADRAQPLVRLLGEHPIGREEQVRVGPLAGSADAAPELVELAEAQQVGPVDDERVHRRHVDARLDDRRAHQHVELALPEVDDDLLEAALVHLPVRHRDPSLGHEVADTGRDLLDVGDAVVHEEDLALAAAARAGSTRRRPARRTRRRR